MNRTFQHMPLSASPSRTNQAETNRQYNEAIRQVWNRAAKLEQSVETSLNSMKAMLSSLSQLNRVRLTVNATIAPSDEVIEIDTTAGNVSLLLLPLSAPKIIYVKYVAGANTLTINGNGDTIDGAASVSTAVLNTVYRLYWNGSDWYTL